MFEKVQLVQKGKKIKTLITHLCLDFDGTVMVYEERPARFHPNIIERLNQLEKIGVQWISNSGRHREGQLGVLEVSQTVGLEHMPTALLCGESFVYIKSGDEYLPLEPWNTQAYDCKRNFHSHVNRLIKPSLDKWQKEYNPSQTFIEDTATAFLVTSVDDAYKLYMEMREIVETIPNGTMIHNQNWVIAIPRELGKGNALNAYLSASNINPEAMLAIGDHHNDISMLDGSTAKHVGCPGDSLPDVIVTVKAANGHVANLPGPLGTLEIIDKHIPCN